MTHHHIGETNAERIADSLIKAGGGNFYEGIRQLVENAVDEGATEIKIEVEGRRKVDGHIRIVDNGGGFSRAGVKSFFSVFISSKVGEEGKIGQHGSGRLFALNFGRELNLYTRSKDYPDQIHFSLSRENLVKLIAKGKSTFRSETVVNSPWLPKQGMGSALLITGVRWEKIPTVKKICDHFAGYLNPRIAKLVRVNGEPLKQRDIVGELVQKTFTLDYLPQEQGVELFVPVQHKVGDGVKLGAINPICDLRDVYKSLDEADQEMIPSALVLSCCGNILIPALNRFRDPSSSKLDPSFYEEAGAELRRGVLRFLHEELSPLVKAMQGRRKVEQEEERREVILRWVGSHFPVVSNPDSKAPRKGGSGPHSAGGNGTNRPSLQVNCTKVTLEPGQNFHFQVTSTQGTSGTFVWNEQNSGGDLKLRQQGVLAIYSAGTELGSYTLEVRDKRHPQRSASISIQIVAKNTIALSPREVQVRQGGRQRFELLDPKGTLGERPTWRIEGVQEGLALSAREPNRAARILVNEEAPLGQRTIVVEGKGHRAEAIVEVVERVKPDALYIQINGRVYRVEMADYHLSSPAECLPAGKGQKSRRMLIDPTHPCLQEGKERKKSGEPPGELTHFMLLAHMAFEEDEQGESFGPVRSTSQRLMELLQNLRHPS